MNATNGEFGGFETALSASAATELTTEVQPARTDGDGAIISGSITSTNIVAKLTAVYDSIPDTVFGKEDLVIYGGTNVIKAWQTALAGVVDIGSFNNQLNVGEKPSNFQGIEKSNLFFGTGLLSDYNEVRVLDMANLDGSQNYRIIMRYTAATQYGVGPDIVYYGAF